MEKITDEDLKVMLTKEESPKEISNKDTGEVQWVKIPNDEDIILDEPKEEPLQDVLEDDFNTIPEVINNNYSEEPLDPILQERDKLTLGLTTEDLQDFFLYISGKGEKPDFVDKFMSDTEGRLKEMASIISLVRLSQIPTLTAYKNQTMSRLFSPDNLYDMDSKTLSATMANLNKEITDIIDSSLKTVQVTNQFGSLNNKYRQIIDYMLLLPPDKLDKIEELVKDEPTNK